MAEWNLDSVGQGIIAALTLLGIVYAGMKGKAKSDGTPPPERAPAPNEVRAAIAAITELRGVMDEIRDDISGEHRLSQERHHALVRQLDSIAAQLRLADAVASVRREMTQPPQPLHRLRTLEHSKDREE